MAQPSLKEVAKLSWDKNIQNEADHVGLSSLSALDLLVLENSKHKIKYWKNTRALQEMHSIKKKCTNYSEIFKAVCVLNISINDF